MCILVSDFFVVTALLATTKNGTSFFYLFFFHMRIQTSIFFPHQQKFGEIHQQKIIVYVFSAPNILPAQSKQRY